MAYTKDQLARLGIVVDKDEVTDEEAQKLIESRFSTLDSDNKKQKKLLDDRNHEIAEFKRKEQEKLSEEEKTKLHYEDLEKENANYKKQFDIANREKAYLGIGYSPDLAKKIAEAEVEGKSTAEFHKQHMDARAEQIKAELLKSGDPVHTNDNDKKTLTKEDFNKMSYADKLKLHEEKPEVYKQMTETK